MFPSVPIQTARGPADEEQPACADFASSSGACHLFTPIASALTLRRSLRAHPIQVHTSQPESLDRLAAEHGMSLPQLEACNAA